ncbi:MAG: helix-turn-helix transcriptional regulator, partial [Verrucomicrobia bacterium]|nr:helix-turn-helix transcriptional regulator [Verrucomicrobiota bacterium]
VKNILEEMGDTRQREVTAHFSEHLGLLMQFLGILSHHLPRETSPTPRNKIHPAVTSAIKLIDETPAETWTLQLLAEKLGLHPNYLCRRFREIVGLSPMNYLTRRRLEMATSLLRRTPLPVGEVGAAVGWSDANYFTRRFQDKFGLSPSKYRTRFTHERKQSNDTPFAASLETEIRRKRK